VWFCVGSCVFCDEWGGVGVGVGVWGVPAGEEETQPIQICQRRFQILVLV